MRKNIPLRSRDDQSNESYKQFATSDKFITKSKASCNDEHNNSKGIPYIKGKPYIVYELKTENGNNLILKSDYKFDKIKLNEYIPILYIRYTGDFGEEKRFVVDRY